MCFEIYAAYDTANVKTTPSYTDAFEPLGATTEFTRKVCLYKLTRQANAKLEFDMCTNNECEWVRSLVCGALLLSLTILSAFL